MAWEGLKFFRTCFGSFSDPFSNRVSYRFKIFCGNLKFRSADVPPLQICEFFCRWPRVLQQKRRKVPKIWGWDWNPARTSIFWWPSTKNHLMPPLVKVPGPLGGRAAAPDCSPNPNWTPSYKGRRFSQEPVIKESFIKPEALHINVGKLWEVAVLRLGLTSSNNCPLQIAMASIESHATVITRVKTYDQETKMKTPIYN